MLVFRNAIGVAATREIDMEATVTPEMIEAGMLELALGDARLVWEVSPAELARIYTAMHRAAPETASASVPATPGRASIVG